VPWVGVSCLTLDRPKPKTSIHYAQKKKASPGVGADQNYTSASFFVALSGMIISRGGEL
jgi:hypothetical protein